MNIIKLLTGSRFQLLIQEAKLIDHLIKKGGEKLLKKSSPEQENAINPMWYRLSLPNPFSVGFMFPLLLIPLVWGWSTLVYHFDLSISLRAILSLSIAPFACIYFVFILYGLRCGYISGLLLIHYFYLFNILLLITGCFLITIQATEFNEWIRRLRIYPLQLLSIYLCRYNMNNNSFYKLISFFHTTRLILEAKKFRESHNKKIK
jgi:hypothetical protein